MRPPRPWTLPTEPTSRAELARMGITHRMVRTALANGGLVAVRRGVVVSGASWPDTVDGRHLVRARAEVAANPGAVLSHQSAALVWSLPTPGFSSWGSLPVSVVLSPGNHTFHDREAVHHVQALEPAFLRRDERGYAVTSPARTAVDLAGALDLPEALVLLDGAARVLIASMTSSVRRKDYANPRLVEAARELLADAAASIRATRLGRVLDLVCPGRESAPESLSAGHMYEAGLPMPRFQAEIRTSAGTFFADCLWEEQRLIGECDGAVKYNDAQAYVREKAREQALRDEGYRFVRWLATETVLQPQRLVERVERALGL